MCGSSKKSTIQYSNTTIPEWMSSGSKSIYDQAKNVAAKPYTPYTGDRIADLSPTFTGGVDLAKGAAGPSADLGSSRSILDSLKAVLNPNKSIADYMNPYLSAVLEPTLRKIRESGALARNDLAGQAASAGAYGDARHGIEEAMQYRDESQNVGDATGRIYASGYDTAQNLKNQDLTRLQQLSDAYKGLDQSELSRTSILSKLLQDAGLTQTKMDQAQKDFDYQQFKEGQTDQQSKLGWLASLLQGLPHDTSQYGESTTKSPNTGGWAILGNLLSTIMPGLGKGFSEGMGGNLASSLFGSAGGSSSLQAALGGLMV